MRVLGAAATLAVLLLLPSPPGAQTTGPKVTAGHGLSMYGDLKYPAGFKHFQYVNPEAPKGGDVKLAATGTFDTLNPFVLKGVPAAGIAGPSTRWPWRPRTSRSRSTGSSPRPSRRRRTARGSPSRSGPRRASTTGAPSRSRT
jgi:ABC-type oligopeptide transport system substrate-binding subunit